MPKIVNHEQRKLEILESALKVLNDGKLTLTKVCDNCNISRTLIYAYYKSKDELIQDIKINFNKLNNKAEKTRYMFKNNTYSKEKYERIYEILEDDDK